MYSNGRNQEYEEHGFKQCRKQRPGCRPINRCGRCCCRVIVVCCPDRYYPRYRDGCRGDYECDYDNDYDYDDGCDFGL